MSNIYIVGFPRSGNTWLVRMLARTLKAKVVKYAMNYETPGNAEKGISSAEEAISRPSRGRPRKTGEVSRATAWRRRKQEVAQGVLL